MHSIVIPKAAEDPRVHAGLRNDTTNTEKEVTPTQWYPEASK